MNELEELYLKIIFREQGLKRALEERNKGLISFKTMEFKNIPTELLHDELAFINFLKGTLIKELKEIKSPLIEEQAIDPNQVAYGYKLKDEFDTKNKWNSHLK